MVHGTGNDGFFPQGNLIKDLLLAEFNVFIFDLPGHGKYSKTILDKDLAQEAIAKAIEFAANAKYIDNIIHLVGISLGGALVIDYLSRD